MKTEENQRMQSVDSSVGYNHQNLEGKWRKLWATVGTDTGDMYRAKKPYYNLMMFPYPSAEGLHVGNMYAFTGSDIYGRFKRMQGYDVFEPIGLDGFGIHSENYAFRSGRHPIDQASISERRFYDQLYRIGAMYDWSRTIETYNASYYMWTQWLFVQMFKQGLAYRARAVVNWCPSCKTVLADEQVIEGACERCGNIVGTKLLEQWFFRITAYAGKLLENLNSLDWSKKVIVAQRQWIGKKEGITIAYSVVTENNKIVGEIACFTTRPDTNFGATFVVIAPEHRYVNVLLEAQGDSNRRLRVSNIINPATAVLIRDYVHRATRKSPQSRIADGRKKTGVFTGLYCVNGLNGYKMPLYVSDFVLMSVGTGAVVGVPGHDTRDFAFAMQFDIPIVRVVKSSDGDTSPITRIAQVQEDEGIMMNSGFLDGLDIGEAKEKMMKHLEEKAWGKRSVIYHLRDWLVSRQRYWGPPIPMVYCSQCAKRRRSWFTTKEAFSMASLFHGTMVSNEIMNQWNNEMAGWYPVPEDQLPVALPRIEDYKPGDDGVAPLAKHKEFYETSCPGCGGNAVRETDVSDTFLDSSWYFLRYPSLGDRSSETLFGEARRPQSISLKATPSLLNKAPHMHDYQLSGEKSGRDLSVPQRASLRDHHGRESLPWDPEITKKWLPVDMYTGGAEHSVLHLLYSRFITMALHDMGFLDFEEPFTRFYAHGLVIKDGAKMSKSKGNVVNPDEYIDHYGVDALRLYLMFMGPFSQGGDFRDSAMEGMYRWIHRLWRLIRAQISNLNPPDGGQISNTSAIQNSKSEIKQSLHKLVKKVTEDTEKRRYNTAIAAMMEFTNLIAKRSEHENQQDQTVFGIEELKTFILLLAPYAPYVTEELWQRVQNRTVDLFTASDSIHRQPWPTFDPSSLVQDVVEVVVQVDGKLRDTIRAKIQESRVKSDVETFARESVRVKKFLERTSVKKIIFIPGKLINFVLSN